MPLDQYYWQGNDWALLPNLVSLPTQAYSKMAYIKEVRGLGVGFEFSSYLTAYRKKVKTNKKK
jgi:hypothetical protein